jgi:hypothetical protein
VAQDAVTSVDKTSAELWRPLASLALARSLIALNDDSRADEIERTIEQGLQCVEAHGIHAMCPQLIECRASLADLKGNAASSRQLLIEALDQYRTIGASGHCMRVERLLG